MLERRNTDLKPPVQRLFPHGEAERHELREHPDRHGLRLTPMAVVQSRKQGCRTIAAARLLAQTCWCVTRAFVVPGGPTMDARSVIVETCACMCHTAAALG